MAGGGGMSSEVSGIERLRENFSKGGVRKPCLSSSVPWRDGGERDYDGTWCTHFCLLLPAQTPSSTGSVVLV